MKKDIWDIALNQTGHCNKCQRHTWEKRDIGKKCGIIQPGGHRCTGRFVKVQKVSRAQSSKHKAGV